MVNLEVKYEKYLELLPNVQDKHGFIEHHGCDALLFSGLIGCLPEVSVDIDAAFDPMRKIWTRRSTGKPCFDCLNNKSLGSKSSISRDMLLGLAWYAWINERLDISEQVIKYAMTHFGFMGHADTWKTALGRCQILPGLFSTYCWISKKLGGPSRPWATWVPADMGAQLKGYQAHLQILHILLRKDLTGQFASWDKTTIIYNASRQPQNPLFLHAAGRDLEAMQVLENEFLWPSDRLPMCADRKSGWLPMRDYGEDWIGVRDDSSFHHHSGGDFLWVYWLIKRKYPIPKRG